MRVAISRAILARMRAGSGRRLLLALWLLLPLLAACTGPLQLRIAGIQTLDLRADGSGVFRLEVTMPPTYLASPELRRLLDEEPIARVAGEPLRFREVVRGRDLHLRAEAAFRRLGDLEMPFAVVGLAPRGASEAELVLETGAPGSLTRVLFEEVERASRHLQGSFRTVLPAPAAAPDPRVLLAFVEECWVRLAFEFPGQVIEASPFEFGFAVVEPVVEGRRVVYELPLLYLGARSERGGRLAIRFRTEAPVQLAVGGAADPDLRCRLGDDAGCRAVEGRRRAQIEALRRVIASRRTEEALQLFDRLAGEIERLGEGQGLELARELLDLVEDPTRSPPAAVSLDRLWRLLERGGDPIDLMRLLLIEARTLLPHVRAEADRAIWQARMARAYVRIGREETGRALLPPLHEKIPLDLRVELALARADLGDATAVRELLAGIANPAEREWAGSLAQLYLTVASQRTGSVGSVPPLVEPTSPGSRAVVRAASGDLDGAVRSLREVDREDPLNPLATYLVGVEARAACRDDLAKDVLESTSLWSAGDIGTPKIAPALARIAQLAHLFERPEEEFLGKALAALRAAAAVETGRREEFLAILAATEVATGKFASARLAMREIERPHRALEARVFGVDAFGWNAWARKRREKACLARLAEADEILLDRFPLLSQRDPASYRDPTLASVVDCVDPVRPEGAKTTVDRLACLATVYTMIAQGFGRADARVDDLYRDPRSTGGCSSGADGAVLARLVGVRIRPAEPLDPAVVERELRSGRPVVLHGRGGILGQHFVLVVGMGRDERGRRVFFANDPWPGSTETRVSERLTLVPTAGAWQHPKLLSVRFETLRRLDPS